MHLGPYTIPIMLVIIAFVVISLVCLFVKPQLFLGKDSTDHFVITDDLRGKPDRRKSKKRKLKKNLTERRKQKRRYDDPMD